MIAFIVTLLVLAAGIALLSIRILMKPDGQFRGTCSTNSPFGQTGGTCACGRRPEDECPNRDNPDHEHHHHDADEH